MRAQALECAQKTIFPSQIPCRPSTLQSLDTKTPATFSTTLVPTTPKIMHLQRARIFRKDATTLIYKYLLDLYHLHLYHFYFYIRDVASRGKRLLRMINCSTSFCPGNAIGRCFNCQFSLYWSSIQWWCSSHTCQQRRWAFCTWQGWSDCTQVGGFPDAGTPCILQRGPYLCRKQDEHATSSVTCISLHIFAVAYRQ